MTIGRPRRIAIVAIAVAAGIIAAAQVVSGPDAVPVSVPTLPAAAVSSSPPAPTAAPASTTSTPAATLPSRTQALPSPAPAPPAWVGVDAVGIRADLVDLDLDRDGALEVPTDYATAGWYVRAPRPGALGPAIIAGHVDSAAGPAAFFRLRDVEVGDAIEVGRVDGTTATFVATHTERHPKDAFPTDEVYGDLDHAGLRLITCGGTFDHDIGHYRDNVIVYARLTD